MKIKDFDQFREVITVLDESGLANKYPDIEVCSEIAWDCKDIHLLEELLAEYPGIYEEALRNIDEIKYWEEKEPFRPFVNDEESDQIKGLFNIGYTNGFSVGLDPIAFTRGLLSVVKQDLVKVILY